MEAKKIYQFGIITDLITAKPRHYSEKELSNDEKISEIELTDSDLKNLHIFTPPKIDSFILVKIFNYGFEYNIQAKCLDIVTQF